ncbi:MAG: hypothetical protein M3R25_05845 [Bacteroidota bacterium]|nr:hypothetical protein [Bacteroidota bacterium]
MTNPIDTEISVDPSIDVDNLRVPPLFIQPYVENAIWHGLAPKKEDLRLIIRIIKQPDGYSFEIEDNGIGRQLSALNRRADQHVSKGLELARETFERYGHVYHKRTDVEILELVDADGHASGTRVILKLASLSQI